MGSSVNFLAILVAAVAAWLYGALYYGTLAKPWVAALGRTMEDFRQELERKSRIQTLSPYVLSFAAEIVIAWVLHGILFHLGMFTIRAGIVSGAFCWFGFVLTTMATNNAYTFRSPKLTLIDAGHWLGVFIIIGGVLGWLGG